MTLLELYYLTRLSTQNYDLTLRLRISEIVGCQMLVLSPGEVPEVSILFPKVRGAFAW